MRNRRLGSWRTPSCRGSVGNNYESVQEHEDFVTVEVPFWPPCFYWFFGSCCGSHDEAGLLAFEAEACPRHAWQELLWKKPPLRTSTCGRHRFRRNNPLWEPRMCRAKSGRRDLMGSQRVARPSLERGMEAASGQKRTPQHEGVTEGRGGNGRKPPPPYNVPHTPLGIRRAGCFLLLCISQTPEMHPRPFFPLQHFHTK